MVCLVARFIFYKITSSFRPVSIPTLRKFVEQMVGAQHPGEHGSRTSRPSRQQSTAASITAITAAEQHGSSR
jgi:hypothetical protein